MDDNLARWSYDLDELKAVQALAEAGGRRPSIHDVQVEALCELLDSLSEAILVTERTDGGDEILFVNTAFTRAVGLDVHETVGASLEDVLSDRTDQASLTELRAAVQLLTPAESIVFLTARGGFHLRCAVVVEPMPMLWSGRVCLMARVKPCTGIGDTLRKHAHTACAAILSAVLPQSR
ncbi:MAG: hypothetical protein IH945_06310 [Armatimonadetes bacterium]|nr:hypothetical protein [Armatimonadota bacterium]